MALIWRCNSLQLPRLLMDIRKKWCNKVIYLLLTELPTIQIVFRKYTNSTCLWFIFELQGPFTFHPYVVLIWSLLLILSQHNVEAIMDSSLAILQIDINHSWTFYRSHLKSLVTLILECHWCHFVAFEWLWNSIDE